MDSTFLTNLVLWYGVFLFSTTLHEAMHSYAGKYGGDDTAYKEGLVTLNPVPHMKRSPISMVVMPLVVFVLTQGQWMFGGASAPFNPYWAARYPRRSFVMSFAGPLSHVAVAGVTGLFLTMGLTTGFFLPADGTEAFAIVMGTQGSLSWALAKLFNVMFLLNILLFLLNIIPVPPFDGSEVWYLFIRKEEDRLRWRMNSNSYSLIGLLLGWWIFREFLVYIFWLLAAVPLLLASVARSFME